MKILFVHQKLQSFVKKDLDILRSAHEVREVCFTGRKNVLLHFIPDLFSLIAGVLWCDITFSWFGKLHAFFAVLFSKILGKKAVVVSGGDDVACEPAIGYGMFISKFKRWCPLFVFKHADLILCVSENNREQTIQNAKADSKKIRVIYHGFTQQSVSPPSGNKRTVLTIGRVEKETLTVKGLSLFIEASRSMPDVPFVLVGPGDEDLISELRSRASKDLTITGGVYGDALIEICRQAKVYVQVSSHESFGCAIAEAMLCECVPVVSRKAAIPEVVGDCGIYVDNLTPEEVAGKIKEALNSDLGKKARERILTLFPIEKRRREILAAIKELR